MTDIFFNKLIFYPRHLSYLHLSPGFSPTPTLQCGITWLFFSQAITIQRLHSMNTTLHLLCSRKPVEVLIPRPSF